jgi:acetylornithine deacetylase/succinyl-diaminopimelate desuccinylase-like protein
VNRRRFLPTLCVIAASIAAARAQAPPAPADAIVRSPGFVAASDFFGRDYDRFVRELISLTEIPAPPFKEQARAAAFLQMLRASGLSDVDMDAEGNVMGVRRGITGAVSTGGASANRPVLALLAHLDTVFPEGTDVRVKRDGTKLRAPGVGDDTRGLALMLTIIRAMDAAHLQTTKDILFVGNVGEEGEGDLRGAKHLLLNGKYKDRIKSFISIDGGDQGNITNGALGSKRYRVTFTGPGGHSYGAFGLVSPAFAMGNAIAKFARIKVPAAPKTTFNVGVVSGGTSVNSIPTAMSMDVDMRSESPDALTRLVTEFQSVVRDAVAEENATRSTKEGKIEADVKLIGDRPSGETPVNSAIVQSATAVVKAFGLTPRYSISSTDSNVPISLGIPAITIGRGPSERSHALDEWTDVEKTSAVKAAQVALAIVLAAAQ